MGLSYLPSALRTVDRNLEPAPLSCGAPSRERSFPHLRGSNLEAVPQKGWGCAKACKLSMSCRGSQGEPWKYDSIVLLHWGRMTSPVSKAQGCTAVPMEASTLKVASQGADR